MSVTQRFFRLFDIVLPEQQGDAPQSGDADDGVDHAADPGGLPAEDPRDQIEPREADQEA